MLQVTEASHFASLGLPIVRRVHVLRIFTTVAHLAMSRLSLFTIVSFPIVRCRLNCERYTNPTIAVFSSSEGQKQ